MTEVTENKDVVEKRVTSTVIRRRARKVEEKPTEVLEEAKAEVKAEAIPEEAREAEKQEVLEGSEFIVENNTKTTWTQYFSVSIPGTYSQNWNKTLQGSNTGNRAAENLGKIRPCDSPWKPKRFFPLIKSQLQIHVCFEDQIFYR